SGSAPASRTTACRRCRRPPPVPRSVTGSDPSSPPAAATNASIACFAGPSRQLERAPFAAPDASAVSRARAAMATPGPSWRRVLAGRQFLVGDDLLFEAADEAVDVVQPVVLDIQGVAAEARAVSEQHAFGARYGDVDERADRVRAVADVGCLGLGHVGEAWVVD